MAQPRACSKSVFGRLQPTCDRGIKCCMRTEVERNKVLHEDRGRERNKVLHEDRGRERNKVLHEDRG